MDNFHSQAKEVFIKTRPTSTSNSLEGQGAQSTTVKWTTDPGTVQNYASVNSSCAQSPPSLAGPPGIRIFLALDGKFPGVGILELAKSPGVGTKKRELPHPPSTLQHFSLIAQSNSAILSILMCDFLLQLTSSFVISLGFYLRLHAAKTCTSL